MKGGRWLLPVSLVLLLAAAGALLRPREAVAQVSAPEATQQATAVQASAPVTAQQALIPASTPAAVQQLTSAPAAVAQQALAPASIPAAVQQYRAVLRQNGFSTSALLDLGNAWMRTGHPGRAILQYERALVLAPRDPVLERALAAARERAGIHAAEPSPWARAVGILTDDAWAWIAVLSVSVLCFALGRQAYGKGGRRMKVLALAGACGTVLAADAIVLRWQELDRAVVVKGGVVARIAPAEAAETSFELREGEAVYLENRFHDYERVRTEDGRSGWIRLDGFLPVRVTAAEAGTEDLPP